MPVIHKKSYDNIFLIIFLFLITSSFSFAQKDKLIYDQLIDNRDEEFYHMPVGLCEDYPEETTTKEIIKNDFEFLKKNNIKFMRISFGWDAIESKQGKYDWLFWDEYVRQAVDDYGITLIPYLCYVPQWASTNPKDTMFFWNYPPKDNKPWGDFIKALVTRYKDRIKTWKIWNEPDIWVYWQGNRQQFVDFMKTASDAVREADPTAKVVFPGIAYDPEFIKDLFKNYNMSKYFDVINMHNYYETWHRHPIEEITNYINEVHDVVWRYGNNQPLWIAEVGYSTFRKGDRVSDSYNAFYAYEHSPEYQAVHLFKTLALIESTEKVSSVAWYELKDLPPSENVIGDNDNNRYLGVAYPDWTPKPATKALKFFNELFSQKTNCIDELIFENEPVKSDVEMHAFLNIDGSVIVTAWLKTMVPGREGNDKSGNVKDNRTDKTDITLKVPLNGKATLYNELGDAKDFTSIEKKSDSTIIKDLELSGGKIAVIKINK